MKLFILLSRVPYPLEKGDKLRAFHQIKHLSKSHEICLVCLNDIPITPEAEEVLKQYCKELHIFPLKKLTIFKNLLKGLFSNKPFQVHYFYDEKIQESINSIVQQFKPDRIFCQLIRTTEYLKNFSSIPKTLDYMDVLSKGIERRIESAGFILRPLFIKEHKRLLAYERAIFDHFEHHVIISEQDRNLIDHPNKDSIRIIANGVDAEFFYPGNETEKTYDLVFTGNMNYPPNVDAAVFLAEEIMPVMGQEDPDFRLLIAGSYPSLEILVHRGEQIHVSGWVDDIRDCYRSARIFIAPMQIGTGLQNKLLEAMAMGLPCITSPLANNALGAKPDVEVLIATSPAEYIEKIHFLKNNPEKAKELAMNGLRFVNDNYKWESNCQLLEQLICS